MKIVDENKNYKNFFDDEDSWEAFNHLKGKNFTPEDYKKAYFFFLNQEESDKKNSTDEDIRRGWW